MNCRQVQKWVLTDYSDGQMPQRYRARVDAHLAGCQACRRLAENVHQGVMAPFQGKRTQAVYDAVWLRIKAKIAQPAPQPRHLLLGGIEGWAEGAFQGLLQAFRPPVIAMACAGFLVLGLALHIYRQNPAPTPYLMYVMDADSGGEEVTDGVERYFL